MHPIAQAVTAALAGVFPPVDGGWTRVSPWRPGLEGVVAMTGHAFVAVGGEVTDARLVQLGADGFGGAADARFTVALAGSGYVEVNDVLLARRAERAPRPRLVPRPDLEDHPRVRLARLLRDDVTAFGWPDPSRRDVVTLGRGVGGLTELGLELAPDGPAGAGAGVLAAALAIPDPGTTVVAACAPGNARAVRTFLRGGFMPIGSVQLWLPERSTGTGPHAGASGRGAGDP